MWRNWDIFQAWIQDSKKIFSKRCYKYFSHPQKMVSTDNIYINIYYA